MQLMYGGDIVAPPGNQVANSEHKHLPVASGVPSLLDKKSADLQMSMVAGLLPSSIAWISADFDRRVVKKLRRRPTCDGDWICRWGRALDSATTLGRFDTYL